MIEALGVLLTAVFAFAYGWFLRSRYNPRTREGMNKYKQKFFLWYVRREIKKFNKKHDIKNRKQQVAFLNNNKVTPTPTSKWVNSIEDRARLDQLMKWEYSLATVNNSFGEDITHRREKPKFSGRLFSEPTPEHWDKYRAKVLADREEYKKKARQDGRTSK